MAPTTLAIVPTKVSQNSKRKRGPTKLKNISADGESRIEVIFDDKGRPIRKGSVKLSSFLGLLVREIVPYTLSDWQNIPSGMAEVLWKSTQVRFKLDQEWERERVLKHMGVLWRASKSRLVTKINSTLNEEELMKLQPYNIKSLHDWQDFVKAKTSENFKKQKSKDPASISRVAVWTAGHTKKNGEPVKTNVDQTVSVNTKPHSNKCKLLDWMGTGEVVAEGRWSSSDPNALVHHIPIGPNAMRVWVDVTKKFKVYYLWRNASDMTYIEEARGTTVAWPADKVIMDSTRW